MKDAGRQRGMEKAFLIRNGPEAEINQECLANPTEIDHVISREGSDSMLTVCTLI